MTSNKSAQGFFSDLKVVELASVLAGPRVGTFFSELGAKVYKIENARLGGDVTRSWKLPSEKPEHISAYYFSANQGKEVHFLDLQDARNKQEAYELIAEADIVLTNFKKSSALKLGFDSASIRKLNPSIIVGTIAGFDDDDPRVAYDVVLQAETGFMSMNGSPESGPIKMPVALIDILAAHQLQEGLLLALIHRYKTGKGSDVRVSLFDSAISSLANQATNWLMAGHVAEREGSLHPNIAPYGEIFTTLDGKQLVIAIGSDGQFLKLIQCLELQLSASDAQLYGSNQNRVEHRKALFELLKPKFLKRGSNELLQKLRSQNVPVGLIKSIDEVFEEPAAQALVQSEVQEGQELKRCRNIAFSIRYC